MPLEQELIDLMLDVLVVESVVKDSNGVPVKDAYAEFTYGEPTPLRCQIVRMNKISRGKGGEELISTLQAILADPTLDISGDDLITLSDGSTPAIIEVLSAKDDEGPYYLEIRA